MLTQFVSIGGGFSLPPLPRVPKVTGRTSHFQNVLQPVTFRVCLAFGFQKLTPCCLSVQNAGFQWCSDIPAFKMFLSHGVGGGSL